jgi:hypothetical protein
MKRRRFLQLAAGAAAVTVIHPAWGREVLVRSVAIESDDHDGLWRCNLPDEIDWSHAHFSNTEHLIQEPDEIIEMFFENHWIIDGQDALEDFDLRLRPGLRYRLRMMNATAQPCFIDLRRRVELTRVNQIPVSGILQDTVCIDRYNVVEADFSH